MFTALDKAFVAPLVALVLAVLGHFGVTDGMTIGTFVTMLVTGVLVFFVPNKKAE